MVAASGRARRSKRAFLFYAGDDSSVRFRELVRVISDHTLDLAVHVRGQVESRTLAAESCRAIDLSDAKIQKELETYMPLIQQGRGAEVL